MAEAKIKETETVCEDRISVLPEDLLVTILDLLPTKDAVATMFLSKRWLFIWTMVTKLEYKDIDDKKKSVWWFLNKSLQLHKSPVIDSFSVELGPQCATTDDVDVGKWVANAVDRLVITLKVKLLWSAGPARLPKCLYSCESLVELTLSDQILVNVPSSSSTYLPSLIELELICVVYKDEDSLVSFLSSCPILEILYVKRKKYDNVKKFTVKVPSLWDLWYNNYSWGSSNDVVDHTDRCLVVDAPAMTYCRINDFSGDSCSIEDMPCLEDAIIDVESYYCDLTSFSSVLSLHLYLSDAMVMHCTSINFSRLIKLSIFPYGSDWLEPLLRLLGNAPKLKQLLVDYKYFHKPEDLPFSWIQPSAVPGCLSSQLEIFEWREYGDRVEEKEFLTYILANSKRLKTATIFLRFDLEEQELIIEELKDLSRASTISHLLFK